MKTNKTRIKIEWSSLHEHQLAIYCEKVFMLRSARKIGDEETVNNFVLGKLNDNQLLIRYKKL